MMVGARLFTVLSVLAGCADDAPRYQLDGLTVRTEDFEEVCEGTFPYFERRMAWLEHETGLARDPAGLIFYWYLNGAPAKDCPTGTGNCSGGRAIYGEFITFSHELVHAHLDRLGSPRVWLSEGMAVMLEDEAAGAASASQTPSEMMQVSEPGELDYWDAAAFTTYLRDRFGMARLLEYYRASAGAGAEEARGVFAEVFGDSFAEVEADYLALDSFPEAGAPACDAPEIEWAGETWEHEFVLACDDPASLGPQQSWNDGDDANGPGLFSKITMVVAPGPIALEVMSSEPVWVTIFGCDHREWVHLSPDEARMNIDLQGGKYLVTAQTYLAPVATATMSARLLPNNVLAIRSGASAPILQRNLLHPCKARHAAP